MLRILRAETSIREIFSLKKKHQNDDANFARKFIKRLIFNVLKDR